MTLRDVLNALAAPAELQIMRFPTFTVQADELALDFDDAFLLAKRQGSLSPAQSDALTDIDRTLMSMSGSEKNALWTPEVLAKAPEWERVRALAITALEAFGWRYEPPTKSDNTYIPGRTA